ncbi:hypothetical protein Dsin_024528 [Dipteronia sinensis]|uniref:Transposon TX1 n=1 Tax=Dipteronia sinensis TaxID=43782 RepID=A0AAE0DWB8_9ROSI|nr:hypothetical protein Dsin_024528 [Dipteronia sinensis]
MVNREIEISKEEMEEWVMQILAIMIRMKLIVKLVVTILQKRKDDKYANAKSRKSGPLKNDNKVNNSDMATNLDTNKGSGSRFDILNEEVDMMMAEDETHTKNKACEDKSQKNKAMLTKKASLGAYGYCGIVVKLNSRIHWSKIHLDDQRALGRKFGKDCAIENIHNLIGVHKKWNKEEFGNLFHNKRRLLARIQGVQKCLSERFFHHLSLLEESLLDNYKDTLEQEEIFWKQKSRNCWLKEGDKNTKFFHLSTIIRMRRNKIQGFKKEDGRWIEEIEEMKKEVVGYFQQLFEENCCTGEYALLPQSFPKLSDSVLAALTNTINEQEVKQSIFNIGGFKAP